MEKRFVSFIIVSMAILLAYQAINMRLNPPPERPVPVAEEQAVVADAGDPTDDSDPPAEADAEQPAAPTATPPPVAEVNPTDLPVDELDLPVDEFNPAVVDAVTSEGEEWKTLGSLDPSGAEQMLVWFSNRGAVIECIALNDPRYTDLDNRHGYLGYLAMRDTSDGVRIGAVGHGTPAANATPAVAGQPSGLQARDIIQQIDGRPIATSDRFAEWIERTNPGQEVRIQVKRRVNQEWETLDYSATLVRRPLEIIRPEPQRPTAAEPWHPFSYSLAIQQLGDKVSDYTADELAGLPSLKREDWTVREIESDGLPGIEFGFLLTSAQLEPFGVQGPLRILKRFTVSRSDPDASAPQAGFHLNYEIVFRNEAAGGPPIKLAYQQNGPTGLPLEGWWYTYKTHPRRFGGAGVRDVVFREVGGRHEMFTNPKIIDRIDDSNPMTPMFNNDGGEEALLDYVGVDSQYFVSALLPNPADAKAMPEKYRLADALAFPVASKKDPLKPSRTDVSFRLISPTMVVEPNQEFSDRYLIFAGPKKPTVLEQYGMEEVITYGWFRVVAKPLTWILHAFHSVFRNYGIAIILLTVLVRGCMFPIGRQQVINAQKMQELAPEMRRIAEQNKNDMEKRAAAQRELFRKHNYNPLAGCLPMFFQLPIFIGLYRALSVDIELRQAPLIPGLQWCSNLAGPDMLWHWEQYVPAFLSSNTGWLGPYLNILPLISVAFMMVHQKMFTPPPTDDQQEMQQKMMKFMMLFFALMFFRVPAGLCLYFITSSAWGLAERQLLPNKAKGAATATESKEGKTSGLLKKMLSTNGAKAPATKKRSKSKSKRR